MNSKDIFISLLKDYIYNSEICSINEGFNYEEVYHLFRIHGLTGIFAAINNKYKFQLPNSILMGISQELAITVSQSVKWDKLLSELKVLFENTQKKAVLVKGPIIKQYYPDPDLRTMGDIDFFVKKRDLKDIAYELNKIGFKAVIGDLYARDDERVELHDSLVVHNLGISVDINSFYDEFISTVKDSNVYVQELSDEAHLVYLIVHAAEHFSETGFGVRHILDIVLLIKNTNINMDNVKVQLHKYGLTNFSEMVFYICDSWFSTDCCNIRPKKSTAKKMSEYILNGGTFGFECYVQRKSNSIARERSSCKSKSGYIINKAFPSDEIIRKRVAWYRDMPRFFLPLAYLYRLLIFIRKNLFNIRVYIKRLSSNNKDSMDDIEFFRELGFYEK